MSTTDTIALLSAIAAIAGLAITLYLNYRNQKAALEQEIHKERRAALVDALHVIDLVHQNAGFQIPGGRKLRVMPIDINEARAAMNKLILYCEEPERVLRAFQRAIGLSLPGETTPPKYGTDEFNEFRNEAARELGLKTIDYTTKVAPWIGTLAGADDFVEPPPPPAGSRTPAAVQIEMIHTPSK